jgi:hypothetical protein
LSLWRRLLAGSEWSEFIDLLSPALFDVVSTKQLSLRAAELARHWFDQAGTRALAECLDAKAVAVGFPMRIVVAPIKRTAIPFRLVSSVPVTDAVPSNGEHLLRFFFFQIYSHDTLFLDLRAERFTNSENGHEIVFRPLPLWVKWRPDFVQGIRQLYDGFYRGDATLYKQAACDLGIVAACDVFDKAFGGEKKHASTYAIAEFRTTFHEVFLRCRHAKVAFHPDFITLGIALATLYDHLETLGGSYDVAGEYVRIRQLLSETNGVV